MDYQETIEIIEYASAFNSENSRLTKALSVAITAMQELQSLHEQGISLERLKDIDFRKEVIEHINYMDYMDVKDELEEYKQLGTLEEVREAVEKQQADKPRIFKLSIHGSPDGYLYSCPNCEYRIIKKDNRGFYSGQRTKCCPNCGKRLDWSEEDD